jgi:hypothetical protein
LAGGSVSIGGAMLIAALTWSEAVSIVAVVVAGLSAGFAFRADRRAGRTEEREKRREAREEAEAATRRQGHALVELRGTTQPTEGPSEGQIVYEYEVSNNGHAVITDLRLWIEDAEGNPVSTGAGGPMTLKPNGPPVFASVGLLHRDRYGLKLMVEWTDADGNHGPMPTGPPVVMPQ